jgi:hypothetical protein
MKHIPVKMTRVLDRSVDVSAVRSPRSPTRRESASFCGGTIRLLLSPHQVKFIPRQAEVTQGVPGRLRPRIFLTFGTTKVADRQPYAPAAFTPGEFTGTHFQRLSRPQSTWLRRGEPW